MAAGRRGAGRKAGLRFVAGVLSGAFPVAARVAARFFALRLGAVFFFAIDFFAAGFLAPLFFAGVFFGAAFFDAVSFLVCGAVFFCASRLAVLFRVAVFFALRFAGTDALPVDCRAGDLPRDFVAADGFFVPRFAPPAPLPDFALVRRAAMEEAPLLFVGLAIRWQAGAAKARPHSAGNPSQ
ncbi:MAG: hypothetical protein SGJ07_01285 [Rhodospirillaceae bacterium]|nr:hypothetical protein [Rhodospirillaceae bacterium]